MSEKDEMVGVEPPAPKMDVLDELSLPRFVVIVEVDKKGLFLLEGRVDHVEHEGQRHERKNVDFMRFTVLIYIFEEVLLVRQFLVVLQVVQALSEYAIPYAALVFVAFARLLPPQIYERLLPALHLAPVFAGRQHSAHEIAVVPTAEVKSAALVGPIADLALRDG